jgi:hypothetical protein
LFWHVQYFTWQVLLPVTSDLTGWAMTGIFLYVVKISGYLTVLREIYQNANISVVAKPECFSRAVAISKMV